MANALEFQFDPASDEAVRRLWAALETNGIPTPAREPGRPHLSLARCDATDPARLVEAVSAFAGDGSSFDVEFGALGVFAPEGWMFLAPVATAQLLERHARVHAWLAGPVAAAAGVTAVHRDSYAPGRWVPHCTLTQRLVPGLAAQTVRLCLASDLPRTARVERIGLTHYPPLAELCSFALGSRRHA
jgi:2'-5' RNA ligase